MTTKPFQPIDCSFCGVRFSTLESAEKAKIIAGPNVFICRDCVGVCLQVMAEGDPEWRDQKIEALSKLRDGA